MAKAKRKGTEAMIKVGDTCRLNLKVLGQPKSEEEKKLLASLKKEFQRGDGIVKVWEVGREAAEVASFGATVVSSTICPIEVLVFLYSEDELKLFIKNFMAEYGPKGKNSEFTRLHDSDVELALDGWLASNPGKKFTGSKGDLKMVRDRIFSGKSFFGVASRLAKIAKFLEGASDHANASKAVKALLKKKFPRTQFSVKSKSFSGGSSVRIDWTDGPTDNQVEALVKDFEYGSFDSSRDLYEHTNVRDDIPQVKYVVTQRSMSPKVEKELTEEIGKKFGVDMADEQAVWTKLHVWPNQAVSREFYKKEYK